MKKYKVNIVNPKTVDEVVSMVGHNTVVLLRDIGLVRKKMKSNHRKSVIGLVVLGLLGGIKYGEVTTKIDMLQRQIKELKNVEDTECDA